MEPVWRSVRAVPCLASLVQSQVPLSAGEMDSLCPISVYLCQVNWREWCELGFYLIEFEPTTKDCNIYLISTIILHFSTNHKVKFSSTSSNVSFYVVSAVFIFRSRFRNFQPQDILASCSVGQFVIDQIWFRSSVFNPSISRQCQMLVVLCAIRSQCSTLIKSLLATNAAKN